MNDKITIVTGATNGIGEVAARELARKGARVIVVGRIPERCEATVGRIRTATGNTTVAWMTADLSLMADIRRFAEAFRSKYNRLHILLNNAGGVFFQREETAEGNEMTFALNHLSYFLLTHLLLDLLKTTARENGEARIVNVSSGAHFFASRGVNFNDIQRKRSYGARGWAAYGESKLMNVMFTYELARRLQGTSVTANVLHPGFVRTGFAHNNTGVMSFLYNRIQQLRAISVETGAKTSIFLAESPEVKGVSGKYFEKCAARDSSPVSYDESAWKRLWDISAQLTGVNSDV